MSITEQGHRSKNLENSCSTSMADKKASNSMHWIKAHDVMLCREIVVVEPYKHKKGSTEAGKIWTEIAQSLKTSQQIIFKQNLSQRAVRKRFALLQAKYKEKEREELGASGISPEQDELDVLLEEITEREKVAEESKENVDRKKQQDIATAQDMRKQAMERMGQTMERMGQTTKRKNREEDEGVMKEKKKKRKREGAGAGMML